MEKLTNQCFDQIKLHQKARMSKTLTKQDILLFAAMSGDVNPAHMNEDFAKNSMFKGVIAHGMWSGSFVSTLLGTELPGPGTIYLGQSFRFKRPVKEGDTIEVVIEVIEKDDAKKRVKFTNTITNQLGEVVVVGESEVIAPTESITVEKTQLPHIELR